MDSILIAHAATLLFAATTGLPWVLERNRQVFQPIKLWSALQIALVAPASILVAYNPEYLHPDVCIYCANGPVPALTTTLLVFSALNAMILLGYYILTWRERLRRSSALVPALARRMDNAFVILVLLMIGLIGFVVKLSAAGGFGFVQDNITQRAALQAGLGPLNFMIDAAFVASALLALRRYSFDRSFANLMLLGMVIVAAVATATLFGGRKVSLQLILTLLMLYALYRPHFMPMSTKTIPVLLGIYAMFLVYFSAVLMYRAGSGQASIGIAEAPGMLFGALADMLLSMSYLDHYIFIVSAFDVDNFYYGATFRDLATSFLPSGLVPDKPPVDDGLYVRVATLGGRLEPGTPAHVLQGLASWPGESLGTGYMNGGISLVLVFGLLQGLMMGMSYRLAIRFPNTLIWPLMMCHVMLNFKISNLRITNLVATLVAVLLIALLVRGLSMLTTGRKSSAASPEISA